MEPTLPEVVIPLVLFLMMIGMGLSMQVQDFVRVFKAPRFLFIGSACQIVGLPLLGLATCYLFGLEGTQAVGTMILVSCAGGVISALITQMVNGNIVLSICMTSLSMVVGVFSIPIVINWSMTLFQGHGSPVELDILATSVRLFMVSVFPIAIGMLIRHVATAFAERIRGKVATTSNIMLVVVLSTELVAKGLDGVIAETSELLLPLAVLNIAAMLLGYVAGKLGGGDNYHRHTLAIEVGVQNAATGIFIARTLLGSFDLAMPAVVYSLVGTMNVVMFIAMVKTVKPLKVVQPQPVN